MSIAATAAAAAADVHRDFAVREFNRIGKKLYRGYAAVHEFSLRVFTKN